MRHVLTALVLGSTMLGGLGVGTAQAEPLPPCAYALTPPTVVQVDGTSQVAASVAPTKCDFPASPYVSVACLQIQGESNSCTQNPETAQILAPYRPGATYVATGRGCGSFVGNSVTQDCQLLGPLTAVL